MTRNLTVIIVFATALFAIPAVAGSITIERSGVAVDEFVDGDNHSLEDSIYDYGILLGDGLGKATPLYRIFLPPPTHSSGNQITSITVTIEGNNAWASWPNAYIGTPPQGPYSLRDSGKHTYNFTGSSARNLLNNAGDGLGYTLDVKIDIGSWFDKYDLKEITVTYEYSNVPNDTLERFQQAYSAYRTFERYKSGVDDLWNNPNKEGAKFLYEMTQESLALALNLSSLSGNLFDAMTGTIGSIGNFQNMLNQIPQLWDRNWYWPQIDATLQGLGWGGTAKNSVSNRLESARDNFQVYTQHLLYYAFDGNISHSDATQLNLDIDAAKTATTVLKDVMGDFYTGSRQIYNTRDEGAGKITATIMLFNLAPLLNFTYDASTESFSSSCSPNYLTRLNEELVHLILPPIISNPRVEPLSGTESTNFEFLVDYYDLGGDPPHNDYKRIYLSDGRVESMVLKSGTASNGTYHFTTTLSAGNYSYMFFFANQHGLYDSTNWQSGPQVFTANSTVELMVEVSGGPITNGIKVKFGHGPDLYNLEYTEWPAPDLPKTVQVDSGEEVMFVLNTDSDNYTFEKWVFRDDFGNIVRESAGSGYGFVLYSGNIRATAYLSYTPLDYTISGTVLRNDGSLVPGGVTLTLTSPVQTLSQVTTTGNWSFSGVKGGVPVTISPTASGGYEFTPPQLVFNNLKQNWTGQTITVYSSDNYTPTTSLMTVPPEVSENPNVFFSWTGNDNVTIPAELVYHYKLDGVDADWSEWSSETSKSYDLSNGAYTFWVRAKDEAGNINQDPASYKFLVNAAPKVISSNRVNNSIWASRITLQMPADASHPSDTFVLLPEHSGINDSELIPVRIHYVDDVDACGANSIIAGESGLTERITPAGRGWLVTLPENIPSGQIVEYDIVWGKIKYFGWQEHVQVPLNFPNLGQPGDSSWIEDWRYLDESYRLWRIASRKRSYSGTARDTAHWMLMNVTDSSGATLISETVLRYSRGKPYTPGTVGFETRFRMGKVFAVGSNICVAWLDEKNEYDGTTTTVSYRWGTHLFNSSLATINNYDSDYEAWYFHRIPSHAINNKIWLMASRGANPKDAWFVVLDSSGNIVIPKTTFLPSGTASLYLRTAIPIGNNVLLLWERCWNTSDGYYRSQIEYQIRSNDGQLVKDTTVLQAVLPDSDRRDDEFWTLSARTDNSGKVWISYGHYLYLSGYKTYYTIFDISGNIWKGPIQTDGERYFNWCDRDGIMWATESGQFYALDDNDNLVMPVRPTAFTPNQSVGSVLASVASDGYRLYDRWSPQPLQIDVPSCANRQTMELFDLNLWNNALHPANLTLKKGDTTVWSQNGQFTGRTTINIFGVLNEGQNLMMLTQDDFLGGQVLVTFPYALSIPGDITGDGKVDIEDIVILAEQWLQPPGNPSADIAPSPVDSIVNFLDFAIMAEHWLEGVGP